MSDCLICGGLHEPEDCPREPVAQITVHVLVHGLPICLFSRDVPRLWPPGHKWVGVDEIAKATCEQCKGGTMSEYGQVWQQVRTVREQLATLTGVTLDEVSRLPDAISLCSARTHRIGALLAEWAWLEAKAAKLDPEDGKTSREVSTGEKT